MTQIDTSTGAGGKVAARPPLLGLSRRWERFAEKLGSSRLVVRLYRDTAGLWLVVERWSDRSRWWNTRHYLLADEVEPLVYAVAAGRANLGILADWLAENRGHVSPEYLHPVVDAGREDRLTEDLLAVLWSHRPYPKRKGAER